MLDINIDSLKNQYTESALAAKKDGFKIYIFGAGIAGQIVEQQFLEPYGVQADFFVEDDKFYRGSRKVCEIPVIPYSDVDKNDPKILLMTAYSYSTPDVYDIPSFNIKGKVFVGDAGACAGCRITNGILDIPFYLENRDGFEQFYNSLADTESKLVMENFLKSRLTADYSYLKKVWRREQYFDDSVVNLESINNYLDCGAYTGDTYEALVQKCVNWKGHAYLFEPDKTNVAILKNKYACDKRVVIIPKAAWNERTNLFFADNRSDTGFISSEGLKVEADSIDNTLDGKIVDFIKMDIEGSEFNALLGAKQTIQTYAPTLSICVYHKKDDLLKLPELIRSFRDDYKFYLRIYKPYSLELVLYAIKKV